MAIILYIIAAFLGLNWLLVIRDVGKPRKPLTGGIATAIVAFDAAIVVALIIAAGRL
jgi:hypothetical protein